MQQQLTQRSKRFVIAGVVVSVVLIYLGFLLSYWWLESNERQLDHADLASAPSETIVYLHFLDLRTENNRADAEVVVVPARDSVDSFGSFKQDTTIRLTSPVDSGQYHFAKGAIPDERDASLALAGDARAWPLDRYHTDRLQADVLTGVGDHRVRTPARIELVGDLSGWSVSSETAEPPDQTTTVAFKRARATLAFDVGICLVLVSLPAMALFVAITTLKGHRKFHPPLTTWFGTMLFAIVPLRNILPDAPAPGAWIDQALVLWVLIALVVAMVLYIWSWWRQSD